MTERKRLIKQLDRKMSEYVRLRDKKCVICGKKGGLQGGHLITRGAYSVRWSEANVFAQCRGCNLLHEYRPYIFQNWYNKTFGVDVHAKLIAQANTIKKW